VDLQVAPEQRSPGLRKAAIIVAMLDTDTAVKVCSELDAETVRLLAAEIARLSTLSQQEREAVLGEFLQSFESQYVIEGRDKARELLKSVLGREVEEELLDDASRTSGIDQLHNLDPTTLYRYLQAELPQTLAVILSLLPADKTAGVLEVVDEELRADLIVRMATLGPLAPGALQALNEGIAELTRSFIASDSHAERVSPQLLADIISNLPTQVGKSALAALEEKLPDIAAAVNDLIFTFEDVLKLDDRSLQIVLRALDERTLALAMKNLPDDAKERILSNLSSRARQMLEQEIELLGQVRVSEVEAAQKKVAATARELAEKGEISLGQSEELI